jgi:RHS repeat-associated protein
VNVAGKAAQTASDNSFAAQAPVGAGTTDVAVTATDPSGNVRTNTYRVSASGAGATYTYDPNGNLASKTEGTDTWAYEWNAENELTRITRNGGEVARSAYDPLGRRVEKVAGGVTTSYTYDGDEIIRDIHGATTVKYVHGLGIDVPLAADDGTSFSYFHADGLASITHVTDAAGTIALTHTYDTWGNLQTGTDQPAYAFTGREWDPETGLYYYRARYYDPRVGRFISEDPIGFEGGDDFYAYVGNNPVTWVDPFGLMAGAMVVGTPIAFNPHDPECVAKCFFNRILLWAGVTGMTASQPVLPKRGGLAGGGKTQGTSVASKWLRKWCPKKLPKGLLGTANAGGVAARALPYLSAGLIVYSVVDILVCVNDCPTRTDLCPKQQQDDCE